MRRGTFAVGSEYQLDTSWLNVGDKSVDCRESGRIRIHASDIDDAYAARMLFDDLTVYFGILLPAVSYQYELQSWKVVQYLLDTA